MTLPPSRALRGSAVLHEWCSWESTQPPTLPHGVRILTLVLRYC
jgi:hypothetical protein